jgi:c-di-GMP-binding flagellar brake protein YcgR
MMKPQGEERRRFPRAARPVCGWLSFRNSEAPYGTLTMDLSASGARFSALRRVHVGEPILLSLQLPRVSIECKGCVVWAELAPNGLYCFGVRFLDLREPERDHLRRFVRQEAPALRAAN